LSVETAGADLQDVDAGGQLPPDLVILSLQSLDHGKQSVPHIMTELLRRPGVSLLLVRQSEARGLRNVASCLELFETAQRAVEQSSRLVKAYGAKLKFLHPRTLSSQDLCLLACGDTRRCEAGICEATDCCEHQRRQRIEQRLREIQPSVPDHTLSLREVPNWDARTKVVETVRNEEVDLIVLPVRRRIWLRSTRDLNLIRDVSNATKSNLLLIR
jgi:hypothetical protein